MTIEQLPSLSFIVTVCTLARRHKLLQWEQEGLILVSNAYCSNLDITENFLSWVLGKKLSQGG